MKNSKALLLEYLGSIRIRTGPRRCLRKTVP